MVRLATTSLTVLVALLQLANAAPQRNIGASDSETCIAGSYMYRSGHTYNQYNANYVVSCAKDSGGDTQSVQKVSRGGFATCFDLCERTKDCAGFTYSGGKEAGNCYLKSKIGSYSSSSDDLVSCHKDPKGKGEKPEPVPGSSTTSQPPAPTTSTSTQSKPAPPPSSSSTSQAPVPTSPTSTKPSITSTSSVSPTPSGITQCQEAIQKYGAVYRGGSGSAYQLSCGVDHYGGDLSSDGSASFLGCVDVCDKNPSCIGYAYTPGTCYLKNYLKDSEVNPNVDFALNIDRAANVKPSVTASSSAPPTGTPAAQPGSCAYLAANGTSTYYNAVGTRYTIECGIDHNGGDLINLPANTFADCSVFCDKTNLCIAYAWTGGNGPGRCYLKSQITGRSVVSDVDYAYKDASTYFPSSSSSASASSSSTKSEPVKTSSTSTSTNTSSSVPPPPPTTWTYRPTWTESKTSSSSSSYVPPPPPPSSSKSSSSVAPTTLTLTHTYTRPTYVETSKSHKTKTKKTKTKTHHTKSSRDAPSSSTSTTLAATAKADTWTYDPWQSRLSQTKTRTVNTSKTKKTKKKKTKTKEPKETMDTKLYPVSYSFPTTTGSSASVSHKTYAYTPTTSSKTYTPVTTPSSSSSSVAPVTTSKPHTQTYWVSTTWTASTTSTSSAWKDDKPPHGPKEDKDDKHWRDRHDEHDRHDDHDRHARDDKHDCHDKDDKHDRHHKDDKERKDRDDHKPAKRDNIFKHLSKSRKPAPTKTRQNPVRTTKIPFGEQKFIDTYEFCDKIRGSKPKYLQAKVIEGNPKFDGFWLEDPYAYNGWKAQLCGPKERAAPIAFNSANEAKVIMTWRDRPGCGFIGFRMYHGDMTEMKTDTWLGQASFSNGTDLTATGHMKIDEKSGEFTWDHEFFDHWLVCDHWEGVPVLKYKDNYHEWDYDMRVCSRVKMFWVE